MIHIEPKLRFKEFHENWKDQKLHDFSKKTSNKNTDNLYDSVLTNSALHGVVEQNSFFDKKIANSENIDKYTIVENGYYIYNPRVSKYAEFGPIRRNKLGKTGVVSPMYFVFKVDKNVNKPFLDNYFITKFWHRYVYSVGNTGARSDRIAIKDSDFLGMPISVPSYKEQENIGLFFSSLDKLINLKSNKVKCLERIKRGYLQKLFVELNIEYPVLRFKGFNDKWSAKKLNQVTELIQGNDGDTDLPVLTISASSGFLTQQDRFSQVIAGNELKNYTLLKHGELSYNHGNSKVAKYGAVFELTDYEKALVPKVYHSFKTNEFADPKFIEEIFKTKIPDRELRKLVSSGARMDGLLNISKNAFFGIKIKLPELKEQQKIAKLMTDIDERVNLQQNELDQLKKLKKGFLQKMFV